MKIQNLFFISCFLLLYPILIKAQTLTVDGHAYLENQTNHSNIKILFERVAPGTLFDSTYTDNTGYFNIDIEPGIYNIVYSKQYYASENLSGLAIYSNTNLGDVTLETGLSGQLSGTLPSGIYTVFDNIQVTCNNDLIIEPGTKLLFKQGTKFSVSGKLLAVGTEQDSIIFTRYEPGITWKGIHISSSCSNTSRLSYCLIEHSDSGGISVTNSSPALQNTIIRNNSRGGICMVSANPILTDIIVRNNSSNYSGAGIRCFGSNPEIRNTAVIYNSGSNAPGLYCESSSDPVLKNVIIANNTGTLGAVCLDLFSNPSFHNVTISNNSGSNCSGIFCLNGNPTLVNCIISNNTGFGIACTTTALTITIHYSNFWNNSSGNFYNSGLWYGVNVTTNTNGDSCDAYNNIQMNPLFINAPVGDYHLQEFSPCIDAGDNSSVSIQTDPDGNLRIIDGNNDGSSVVDMGAYEYDPFLFVIPFKDGLYTENKIYPNPCNDYLFVEINKGDSEICMFNSIGQSIYVSKYLTNKIERIDLSDQAKGLFFIKINNENGTIIKKVIKF